MKGMLYCRLCKATAFVKTNFGKTSTLDCGHVVTHVTSFSSEDEEVTVTRVAPSATTVRPRKPAPDPPKPASERPATPSAPSHRGLRNTSGMASLVASLVKGKR